MSDPVISILVPTYRRPALLQRNLRAAAQALAKHKDGYEVLVGDNAGDPHIQQLVENWGRETGIPVHYLGEPTPNMQANHQRLLWAARGRWVLVVHDDDWLLPSAGATLLRSAQTWDASPKPIRHGVLLADANGRTVRRLHCRKMESWNPREAVRALVTHSHFIKMPGLLLHADQLREAGGFRTEGGLFFDWATWLAVCSRHGLVAVPDPVAAYSRHESAATEQEMFQPGVAQPLANLLIEHAQEAGLSEAETRRRVGRFIWRFGLAGAWRAVRRGDIPCLRKRLADLEMAPWSHLPCPLMGLVIHGALKIRAGGKGPSP